jgi:hypothetical protein
VDHFEGVVLDYLRANKATFVNAQFCIQLNPGSNPDTSGPHWYCDAVAINFKNKSVHLCEITYASPPASLVKRLGAWSGSWPAVCEALRRDSGIPEGWHVQPWLFVRRDIEARILAFLAGLPISSMPPPRITHLEDVLPWHYCSWDRPDEAADA